MGLSASQGRLLLLTARKSDLEFRAQQISHKRLLLAQQLTDISNEYEEAVSNKQMKLKLYTMNSEEKADYYYNNLTYAYLVSGALYGDNANFSGLRKSKGAGTEGLESWANNAYRLTNGSGDIIVSSLDEIPDTEYTPTVYYKDKNASGSDTALKIALKDDKQVEASKDGNMIRIRQDDNTYKYYNVGTGVEATTTANGRRADSLTDWVKMDAKSLTESGKSVGAVTERQTYERWSEGDGKYGVKNLETGETITYRVDPGLKGNSSEPNYLQDCIRNGKYLIQKGAITDNGYKWTDLSWESMSDLNDTYYVDDDAAAQAKYDRLQQEIQNQDKKLEIELDNLETQRNAVNTEIESVQKVISDNIEGSFKIFS